MIPTRISPAVQLGWGTVFKINTNGADFSVLKSFASDNGAHPYGGLVLSGNTLYGTTADDGSSGQGTVFSINTDGTSFTVLKNFPVLDSNTNSDGAQPHAGLVLNSNMLYGTTYLGGSSGRGTIFSLTLPPPPLLINVVRNTPVVFWPNDGLTHILQMTTNLGSGNWTTVSNAVPLGGWQVTNLLNQPNVFFRLQ